MLLREEDYINNEYYAYNRLLFRILGLWDYQTSFKQLLYVCFLNFIIVIGTVNQIYYLIMSERKINLIAKLLETTLPTVCYAYCYYNLQSNGVIMRNMLHRIKCDWNDLADKPELDILKKYAHLSRLCTIIIAISFYMYTAFLMFPSFIKIFQYTFGAINQSELILPVHINYLMKNQIYYFAGVSIQYVIILVISTIGIANYTMFIAIIQHSCALFSIIEWRINERFKKKPSIFYYSKSDAELAQENEWMIGTIKFYNKAIEFVNLIKLFYEAAHILPIFLVLIWIIMDYFYMFQIFSLEVTKAEGLRNICYIIGCIFLIYIYFYLGQKLIDHNASVFITFRQIPFYSLSLKTQKILLIFLMNSMRICNLSVVGVNEISHDMLASLMRTSYSFAMVLFNL